MNVKRTKQEVVFRLEIDREYLYGTKDEKKNAWPYDMVIEMLKDPDYVKVVRCKDCKWCEEHYDIDGLPYWICKNWVGGTDADGFCHEAERRTDE